MKYDEALTKPFTEHPLAAMTKSKPKNGIWLVCRIAATLLCCSSLDAANVSDKRYEPVSVKRQVEPNYPHWAYSNGVSQGFARVAFYVDEEGNAAEFMPIEHSHTAFSEELLRVLRKWKFVPAHFEGHPVKSVCRAHWEFLPDRPVRKTLTAGSGFHFRESEGVTLESVSLSDEGELDRNIAMLEFPPVFVVADSWKAGSIDDFVVVSCSFFVDTDGAVGLPLIESSSDPRLNELVIHSLRRSGFERPFSKGQPTVTWLRKTYRIPIVEGGEL